MGLFKLFAEMLSEFSNYAYNSICAVACDTVTLLSPEFVG